MSGESMILGSFSGVKKSFGEIEKRITFAELSPEKTGLDARDKKRKSSLKILRRKEDELREILAGIVRDFDQRFRRFMKAGSGQRYNLKFSIQRRV